MNELKFPAGGRFVRLSVKLYGNLRDAAKATFPAASILALLASVVLAVSCVGTPAPDAGESTVGSGGGKGAAGRTILPGGSAFAPEDPLPLAPELLRKTLDNGLTLYVRRNGNPGGRAIMYLLVATGSSSERDDQAGYAHFVEHMAFNGTTNFPENDLVNYLRSIGMDFGAEINAHTTREETLYILEMPLSDSGFFETGLTVLKDWATGVTFDPSEVEKEKGVILEEMRLGRSADEDARIREVSGLLAGTRHEKREPIGTEASVRSATAESLREFYREHYRPDRMAVIIVGDIDVADVAAKAETVFSYPAGPGGVQTRKILPVAPTSDMGFVKTVDSRFERSVVTYRKIVPYEPEVKIGDYVRLLKGRLAAEAIQLRLADLSRAGGTPWRAAYFSDDYFYGRTRLYSFTLTSADGGELAAFAGLAEEVERLRRFGFTDSEFRRTIDTYRRWLGSLDVEDEDLKSGDFAQEYVRNFMYGEPVPGVVNERVYIRATLDAMTIEDLNATAREILAADEGFVAVRARTDPPAARLTEAEFEKVLRGARTASLSPPVSGGDEAGLFDDAPPAGTIVSAETLQDGLTRLVLSNGATVLLKPTTFDRDSIGFLAWSPGGYSVLPVRMQTTASFASSLMSVTGLGAMSATRMEELTASINAGLDWDIGENAELMVGKTTRTDLASFLRLVYLQSAEPGRDRAAFDAAKDRLVAQVGPYVRNPDYRFEAAWSQDLYAGNPRAAALDARAIASIDFDATRALVVSAFGDASEFTYMLVGDFDLEKTKELVATYLGAIPAGALDAPLWISPLSPRSTAKDDTRIEYPFSTENRASVRMVWAGTADWSWEREAQLDLLAQALNNRLLDSLREDLGATYVVSTRGSFNATPVGQYSLTIRFDTSPDRADELIRQVRAEVATLSAGTFDARYVAQVKTAAERAFAGRQRTNDFWLTGLGDAVVDGLGYDIVAREKTRAALATGEGFRALAAELLVPAKSSVYVMVPED